jgi:hypothetical protein
LGPVPCFRHRHCASRLRAAARGQALLILVATIGVAAMLLVFGSTTEAGRAVKADAKTRAALDYARQALIGRAIGDANRPGSLPCPDLGDDGSAELFVGSACPSYIGRFPWRTLGVGDLRDETGERLWYALSPGFRDHPRAPPINSDTRGTLTVHSGSDGTVITREAVAVVFAPGSPLPGQLRDDSPAQCASTGRHIPRNRCVTNYLDTAANLANTAAAGPYIAAAPDFGFNDKLTVISTPDFMPLVEQRVALETRNALLGYRAASSCGCYPWPDGDADGSSDGGASRGRLPVTAAAPHAWTAGSLPAYFAQNQWSRVIYYAVARAALENAGRGCNTCTDASLSVDGASGYDVVLLTTGYAIGGKRSDWSEYIDDAENRNDDDRYSTPLAASAARDRLYAIRAPAR